MKDPRFSVTLPVWQAAFENHLKVVMILRHPIDVAQSLVKIFGSGADEKAYTRTIGDRYPILNQFRFRRCGWRTSYRCRTLDGAFQLCLEYHRHLMANAKRLKSFHMFPYERLLQNPDTEIKDFLSYLEVDADAATTGRIIASIRPSRQFAFLQDPERAAFAQTHAEEIRECGYSPTGFLS